MFDEWWLIFFAFLCASVWFVYLFVKAYWSAYMLKILNVFLLLLLSLIVIAFWKKFQCCSWFLSSARGALAPEDECSILCGCALRPARAMDHRHYWSGIDFDSWQCTITSSNKDSAVDERQLDEAWHHSDISAIRTATLRRRWPFYEIGTKNILRPLWVLENE